jgi:hypothetical protein
MMKKQKKKMGRILAIFSESRPELKPELKLFIISMGHLNNRVLNISISRRYLKLIE